MRTVSTLVDRVRRYQMCTPLRFFHLRYAKDTFLTTKLGKLYVQVFLPRHKRQSRSSGSGSCDTQLT